MIKTYLKNYLYFIIIVICLNIIISLLNNILPFNNTIFLISILPISMFISCIFLGKKCKEKAYFEGIKFGIIYLIINTLFIILIKAPFTYKTIIIYILIILSSVLGSMLGINLKKE